jgi:hypothetical protein
MAQRAFLTLLRFGAKARRELGRSVGARSGETQLLLNRGDGIVRGNYNLNAEKQDEEKFYPRPKG